MPISERTTSSATKTFTKEHDFAAGELPSAAATIWVSEMYIESIPSKSAMSDDVQARVFFVDEDQVMHWVDRWSLDSIVRPATLKRTQVKGQVGFDFQGFYISIQVLLLPGRDHKRLYFERMDSRQQDLLKLFYRSIRSGEMVQVEEVIQALDSPVEKVPMYQTEEELRQARGLGIVGRAARGLVTLSIYLLLAAVVLGTLAYSGWSRWNFVDMANARVVADGDALAVQGWLHDDDVTDTWIGMPADIRLNIDGNVVSVPAEISKMLAGSEAGFNADEGYLVQIGLTGDGFAGQPVPVGTPVEVVLDRDLEKSLPLIGSYLR